MADDNCYICDKAIQRSQAAFKCFICKCDTHKKCSDLGATTSPLLASGALFYACRICRSTLSGAATASRTTTTDDQLESFNADFENKIRATDDSYVNCEKFVNERIAIEAKLQRCIQVCSTERAKLVKIVRTRKKNATNDDYDKLFKLYTDLLKASDDYKLSSETMIGELRAQLTVIENGRNESNKDTNIQQRKKRRYGDMDDVVIVPTIKEASKPKETTPKLTFAEAVKQSSDTPIHRMRIIRFNAELPSPDNIFDDEIFKDKAIKSMNTRGENAFF